MSDTLADFLPDWTQHLRATGLSPRTVTIYEGAAVELIDFLKSTGAPIVPSKIRRKHLERYLAYFAGRPHKYTGKPVAPAYVNQHYRSLRQLFRWLYEVEEEIKEFPFERMKPPKVPEKLTPVLDEEQLRLLLDTCRGSSFTARRDTAIIRMFLDTGVRRAELLGLDLDDADVTQQVIHVVGKGRRPRSVPFGDKTGEALRRYLRARRRHRRATETDRLWIGRRGPLDASGLRKMLIRRVQLSGIPHTYPHMFRHTLAHRWLADGLGETDLMRIAGWKSRQMLDRYGASAADERAMAAHKRAGLGDRV